MADSSLSVKISADTSALTAQLAIAQSSMRSFNAEMKDLANQITAGGAAARADLLPQLEAAAAGFAQAKAQAGALRGELSDFKDETDQTTTSLGGLQGAFLNWEAVKEVFNVLKSAAEEVFGTMIKGAEDIDKLSFSLGISNQAANTLQAGIQIVGLTTEDYLQTVTRLERQMRQNEERFNALGVVTRDANNQFVSGQALIENAITALDQYKQGTDRQLAATVIFGRSLESVYKLHLLNNQVMQEGADVLARYGLATDEQGILKAREFSQNLNELSLIADKVTEKFGLDVVGSFGGFREATDQLVPELMKLEPALVEIAHDILVITSEIPDAIAKLNDMGSGIAHVLNQLAGIGDTPLQTMNIELDAAKQHLADVQNNVFTVVERLNPWFDKQHAILDDTARIAELTRQIAAAGGGAPAANPPHDLTASAGGDGGSGGGKSFVMPGSAGASDAMAQWREQLQQQIQDQIGFFADSTALEISYWQNILDTEKLSAKEREEVEKAMWEARKKEAQTGLSDYIATTKAKQAADKDDFTAKIALEDQLLQVLATDYGIDSRQYQDELRVKEGMLSQHLDQVKAAEEKHEKEMEALAKKAADAQAKEYQQLENTISRTFDSMLTGVLQGTQTLQEAMGRMLGNLIISFIEADIKRLLHWVITEQAMTTASVTGSTVRTAAAQAEGAASGGTHAAGAIQAIIADAAKAYSGVFAWAAPVLGPFAAVPAAAAFALVAGMETLIPSAAGGWVLPQDSLVSAHAGEMILPANLTAGIKNMIEGGGQSGGAAQVNFSVTAVDAAGVAALFANNGRALASIVANQFRDNPSLRPSY